MYSPVVLCAAACFVGIAIDLLFYEVENINMVVCVKRKLPQVKIHNIDFES